MSAGDPPEPPHAAVVRSTERFFAEHGDSYLGMGWTKSQEQADWRYEVMLGVIDGDASPGPTSILDLGCGLSHLYEYMLRTGRDDLHYAGVDLLSTFLERCRAKFPGVTYHQVDILRDPDALPQFDYVVMNGLLTQRDTVPYDEMLAYAKELIRTAFSKARRGLAFNVMSKQVEWERDDLFHVPFDQLAGFLASEVSRHFVLRHDYGLYEYTAYLYREPRR